jgi:WD40 repeat protein
LSAFQECDRDYFFGRERFVEQLVSAIQRQPLVAVIGPSGSGKTSVVRAGLFPQLLDQGNWLIDSFRPGYPNNNPFRNLASVLVPLLETQMNENERLEEIKKQSEKLSKGEIDLSDAIARILQKNSHKRLLLFVDQFEELYTLCRDTQEQQRFVDTLLAAVQSAPRAVTLVLTLRADFYSYVLNYPAFGEALEPHNPLSLRAMNQEEMLSCIERPAEKMGVKLAEGLTQLILKDVKQEPGNLPLLEFALTQLWEKQSQGKLTHEAYEQIGGVEKALALHAEAVYTELSEEEQKQAQRLFVQLVRPGEGTEDTRRLATPAEVGNWELVTRLADARLVVTGRDEQTEEKTVEVVHEALIREWERLRGWMESDRTFRTWQDRLRAFVRQWETKGKDEGALLRGVSLAEAEDWLQKREPDLTNEREYIEKSLALRKREQEEQKHRRQFTIFGLTGFSVFALSLAVVAWWQWQHSEGQRRTAEVERLSLSALQKVENAPIAALVIAMQSGQDLKALVKDNRPLEQYPTVSPLLALQTILDNIRQQNQFYTKQQGVNSVIFDEDSKQIVTAGEDDTVRLLYLNGKEHSKIEAHQGGVRSVRFLDKNTLVTGGKDGTAKRWDISSPKQPRMLQTFKGHQCNRRDKTQCGVNNVRTPNSNPKIIATSGDDGTLRLWNLQGQELSKVKAHQDSIESINFSRDDRLIATAGKDGVAKLWQLNGHQITKTPVAEFKGHQGSVHSVFFSYKSNFLATAGEDGTVRLWNFQGKELQKFPADIASVKAVRVSEDDKLLATASSNGTVKLWSLNINNKFEVTPLAEFKGHQGSIESIRFSKHGKTLVSAGADDGMVKIWTVPEKKFIQLKGHKGSIKSVRFSPDGNLIATGGDDNKVILWKRDGNRFNAFKAFPHPSKVNSVRFSPKRDDQLLATAGEDGKVRLWDRNRNRNDKPLPEFEKAHEGSIKTVNFSPDGKFLATGGEDGKVILWNRDGKLLQTFHNQSAVEAVRFSWDGKLIATVGENGMAWLWDKDNPQQPKAKLIAACSRMKYTPETQFRCYLHWFCVPHSPEKRCIGHQGTVYGVSFSPDGKEVFTAGDDGIIRRWDLNGKQLLPEVKTYQTSVRNITFSKDGNLLATVGAGGTVKLWTSSGQQLAEFLGHQGIVNSAAFSDDGNWLATAGDDSTAIVWHVRKLDDLLKEGCTRLKDYLSTPKDQQDKELKELKDFCDSK